MLLGTRDVVGWCDISHDGLSEVVDEGHEDETVATGGFGEEKGDMGHAVHMIAYAFWGGYVAVDPAGAFGGF